MSRYSRLLFVALFVGIAGLGASYRATDAQTAVPTAAATATPSTCPEAAALQASQESDIVALVNKARVAANMNPLTVNKMLDAASQRQSNDMAAKDFLDHTGSDGSDVGARATAAGYAWSNIGENILYRLDMSAAGAYDQWWNSPGHKANMMNPAFTEIGVTFACTVPTSKYYYAMVLAASLDGSSATPSATLSATLSATDASISGDNSQQPADATPAQ